MSRGVTTRGGGLHQCSNANPSVGIVRYVDEPIVFVREEGTCYERC